MLGDQQMQDIVLGVWAFTRFSSRQMRWLCPSTSITAELAEKLPSTKVQGENFQLVGCQTRLFDNA